MRIAMAQCNPTVGDLDGNVAALRLAYEHALDAGADLVMAGELALTGYPPEDLVLEPAFITAVSEGLSALAESVGSVPLVVGFVDSVEGSGTSLPLMNESQAVKRLANAAAVLRGGTVEATYHKQRIPNYGVFDEARYFQAGESVLVTSVGESRVGITICEDLWGEGGPVEASAAAGADVCLSLNASPYERGKRDARERWARHHARHGSMWLAYCNIIGGQDEVVFDGDSFVTAPDGTVTARGAQFAEDLVVTDIAVPRWEPVDPGSGLDHEAMVYEALVLATRDYLVKNSFSGALVGVSGGIDSALTAAVAVDAVGPEAVTLVAMPSPHSSQGSLDDAHALADALGARYHVLPIKTAMEAFESTLATLFEGTGPGVAEENIQSRIRGTLVMALSNKFGDLLLATGNKSELAVGYATLYGDMAGGFAPIKDVPKLLVYELARWRNREVETIPAATIEKPPSAELRPGQMDSDSLPDYETLDDVIRAYVELDLGIERIVARGHDRDEVRRLVQLIDRAEYKRRQAAPGPKITERAFGRDRRVPITNGWRG